MMRRRRGMVAGDHYRPQPMARRAPLSRRLSLRRRRKPFRIGLANILAALGVAFVLVIWWAQAQGKF